MKISDYISKETFNKLHAIHVQTQNPDGSMETPEIYLKRDFEDSDPDVKCAWFDYDTIKDIELDTVFFRFWYEKANANPVLFISLLQSEKTLQDIFELGKAFSYISGFVYEKDATITKDIISKLGDRFDITNQYEYNEVDLLDKNKKPIIKLHTTRYSSDYNTNSLIAPFVPADMIRKMLISEKILESPFAIVVDKGDPVKVFTSSPSVDDYMRGIINA